MVVDAGQVEIFKFLIHFFLILPYAAIYRT